MNAIGEDITGLVFGAAGEAGVPVEGLLALMIAESGLNPRAERWGGEGIPPVVTQEVINRVWPDISFGYTQQIVLYHWAGDRTRSVENVLMVREIVFKNPVWDVMMAARKYAGCLERSGGDVLEGLYTYNWGHNPTARERETQTFVTNSQNQIRALKQAGTMLGVVVRIS